MNPEKNAVWRTRLIFILFQNALLSLLVLPHYVFVHPIGLGIIHGVVLSICPGYALVSRFIKVRERFSAAMALGYITSAGLLAASVIGHYCLKLPISSSSHALVVWLASNLLALKLPADCREDWRRLWQWRSRWPAALALFIAVGGCFYWAGIYLTPPNSDIDLQGEAAGYGMIKYLRPYYYQERKSIFEFSITPLVYLAPGGVFLMSNRLDYLQPYYDLAMFCQRIKDLNPEAKSALLYPIPISYPYFEHNPFLAEIRTMPIQTALVLVFFLFTALYRLSGLKPAAVLGTLVIISFPEMLVRLPYGPIAPYYDLCLIMALLYLKRENLDSPTRSQWWSFFIGGFALYLFFHKAIFFPAALLIYAFAGYLKDGRPPGELRRVIFHPLLVGFVAGFIPHYTYGLLLDPRGFLHDHFFMHFVGRYYLGVESAPGYLSLFGLWNEYGRFLGRPFLLIALVFVFAALRNIKSEAAFFSIWFLTGAAAFSLVDWKCTRHLSLVTLPLAVPLIVALGDMKKSRRAAMYVFLCGQLGYNIWVIYRMALDFSYLSPTPAW